MITVQALKELGADTSEGLARCMNNEAFYLRMVGMGLADGGFEKLRAAIENDDLDAAFEASHALKGVMANLSLSPIAGPVGEMTELLRTRTSMDYRPLLEKVLGEEEKFTALL